MAITPAVVDSGFSSEEKKHSSLTRAGRRGRDGSCQRQRRAAVNAVNHSVIKPHKPIDHKSALVCHSVEKCTCAVLGAKRKTHDRWRIGMVIRELWSTRLPIPKTDSTGPSKLN